MDMLRREEHDMKVTHSQEIARTIKEKLIVYKTFNLKTVKIDTATTNQGKKAGKPIWQGILYFARRIKFAIVEVKSKCQAAFSKLLRDR